jgi:hypothetical protein
MADLGWLLGCGAEVLGVQGDRKAAPPGLRSPLGNSLPGMRL